MRLPNGCSRRQCDPAQRLEFRSGTFREFPAPRRMGTKLSSYFGLRHHWRCQQIAMILFSSRGANLSTSTLTAPPSDITARCRIYSLRAWALDRAAAVRFSKMSPTTRLPSARIVASLCTSPARSDASLTRWNALITGRRVGDRKQRLKRRRVCARRAKGGRAPSTPRGSSVGSSGRKKCASMI